MRVFLLLLFWPALASAAADPAAAFPRTAINELLGHPIGVEEDSDRIIHTVDKNFEGKEIMIVFKEPRDGIVWKLEKRNRENVLISSVEKLKDGRQLIKNFGSKGNVVSMVEVDRTGKSKITNYRN